MSGTAAATPVQPAAGPRIVYVAPSKFVKGAAAAPAGQTPAASPAPGQVTPAGSVTGSATAPPGASSAGAAQAAEGAAQAQRPKVPAFARLMGLLPLAAGITQAFVGFLISTKKLPIEGITLIGGVPPMIVGGLVAATSTASIMSGLMRVLGKA